MRVRLTLFPLSLAGILAATGPILGASAPQLGISESAALPTPLPLPYNAKANAREDVAAAFDRAKASGKRVLIDFGGNWCPDCRILSGVMELPAMKPFLAEHFEMVSVDVGKFDHNMEIAKFFGAKITGVPYLVIAEAHGKLLASSYEVTDEKHTKPQQMADWLAQWAN